MSVSTRLRKSMAALFSAFVVIALALSGAAPASAQALEVTCTGSQTVTYSPGLVLFEDRDVQVDGSTSYDCISSSVTSGTSGFSVFGQDRNCVNVAPQSTTEVITWNDSTQSVLTLSVTIATVGGTTVVTKNGTVTSGRFAGDLAVVVVTGPAISGLLDCLTPQGLTVENDTVVLEITSGP